MKKFSTFRRFFRRITSSFAPSVMLLTIALAPATAAGQLIDTLTGGDVARSSLFADPSILAAGGGDNFPLADGGSTWIRHIGGGGPGWQPFTSIGGAVPLFADNGALIIEAQGLVTNDGNGGGTIGFNRRFFVGESLAGAGFWYDVNQSPNEHVYHQTACSLELFFNNNWTIRNNGYLPVGQQNRKIAGQSVMGSGGTVQFQNNNLIVSDFNSLQIVESAMRGIDVEIARSIADWSGEAFLGYYHFRGDVGGSTNGIKGGLRGYVTPSLAGNITVSEDRLFGTNVYGGFTLFLGGNGGKAPRTIADKLTIPVERNQQVVINEVSSGISHPGSMILTNGGQPITVTHVNSNAVGSNTGTFENPFFGLPPTQNTDFVYAYADSNFNNQSYSLNPGQRFLGEGDGNLHTLFTDQFGPIILPPGNGGVNRPIIQAADGQYALNSAANTEISNVRIDNSGPGTRAGIFGDAGNVNVNRTVITGGTFGIDLDSPSGTFTFNNVDIVDPTDTGFRLNGGSADITFDANSSISTDVPFSTAVLAGGHHTGSLRFDPGSQITVTDGFGISLGDYGAVNGLDGQYDFLGTTTLSGPDVGIILFGNSSGQFTFGPDTLLTNTAAEPRFGLVPAILIGTQGFGNDTFTGRFDFNGTVDIFTGDSLAVSIDQVGVGGVVNFNNTGSNYFRAESDSIVVNSAFGEGIEILNTDGTVNFDIPTTLINIDKGINVDSFTTTTGSTGSGTVSFTDTTIIKNNDLAETGAISVFNHSGTVKFTNLDLTMTTTTVDPVLDRRNPGLFFAESLVDSFYASDVGTLIVNGTSRIDATEAQAVSFHNIGTLDATFDTITVADNVVSEELNGPGFPNDPTGNVLPHNAIELGGIGGGSFHVNRVDIARSSGSGIEIKDYAGTFTIDDGNPGTSDDLIINTTGVNNSGQPISNPNGITFAGIDISNSPAGTFTFAGVDIRDTGGAGIRLDNVGGSFAVSGGNILNGGDAGIDIIGGSTGTFTFTDATITDPTGTGINVDGGSATIIFDGLSSISKNNAGSTVRVQGGHDGTLTFNPGTGITTTSGDGLQFDNANGLYDFDGQVTLNGGDAGIDIIGSAGQFTFTDTTITDPTGTAFNVNGGGANVTYSGGSITQGNNATTVNVQGGHTGTLNFGIDIGATNGDGLQFNNADGTYNFNTMTGTTTLNGGDAGIDIIGGSDGTFTFGGLTTITNPSGPAVNIDDLGPTSTVTYNGSILHNTNSLIRINNTAAGSTIKFNATGSNSLTSTGNPNPGIDLFDVNGDLTITTPATFTDAGFSPLFATLGSGVWSFTDLTVIDLKDLNGGIDVFANSGTVNFTNLSVSTDTAGTGRAAVGFLVGGLNNLNVFGNSSISANGGPAISLVDVENINMTFQSLSSINNPSSQIGPSGNDGVSFLNVRGGTFDVTGTTTVHDAGFVGISLDETAGTFTFANVDISGTGLSGVASGVATTSTSTLNINGGTIDNTTSDGLKGGSTIGAKSGGNINLNNVGFTNIGAFTTNLTNTNVSGAGNTAVPFSSNDGGGNTGTILFNGGVDSAP